MKVLVSLTFGALMALSAPAFAQTAGSVEKVQVYAYGTPPGSERVGRFINDTVVMNEALETVAGGALRLRLADNSEFTMGPEARIVIDSFVYDPSAATGTKAVTFAKGAFRYVSGNMNRDGVQLKVPVATIGIRGTTLFITVLASGASTIAVPSGAATVALINGRTVDVNEGQSIMINERGDSGTVVGYVIPTPVNAVNEGLPNRSSGENGSGEEESEESSSGGSLGQP